MTSIVVALCTAAAAIGQLPADKRGTVGAQVQAGIEVCIGEDELKAPFAGHKSPANRGRERCQVTAHG